MMLQLVRHVVGDLGQPYSSRPFMDPDTISGIRRQRRHVALELSHALPQPDE